MSQRTIWTFREPTRSHNTHAGGVRACTHTVFLRLFICRAVLWLEDYLTKYEKTLIIVSHDRSFLDHVITDTVHYYQKQLNYYRGNYSIFEKIRGEKMKQMKRDFETQKAKVSR
jgi:uncharacterized protein YbcI